MVVALISSNLTTFFYYQSDHNLTYFIYIYINTLRNKKKSNIYVLPIMFSYGKLLPSDRALYPSLPYLLYMLQFLLIKLQSQAIMAGIILRVHGSDLSTSSRERSSIQVCSSRLWRRREMIASER